MTTADRPTLLFLHGLGATAAVWSGVRSRLDWAGPTVAPDLPGHGGGSWTGAYDVASLAEAVAAELAPGEETFVVGHSLGGGVGLELASGRYRPAVVGVIGIGIKTTWTDDDIAGMARVAERGIRWFDTRADAEQRYLRQAGLDGIVEPDADRPELAGAVVGEDGPDGARWRVAQDPATFAQRPLPMAELVAGARCPIVLAAGEHDPMATRAELARFVDQPEIATGRGHNVQVEDPAWVADLVRSVVGGDGTHPEDGGVAR